MKTKNKAEKRKLIAKKKAAEERKESLKDMETDLETLKFQIKTEREKVGMDSEPGFL